MFRSVNLNKRLLLPAAVLLAAWALRIHQLGAQSMWFDEAARLLEARAGLSFLLSSGRYDTLPPFFHITMYFWQGLGDGDFWLRIPPALASLLLVAVVYRLGRVLFDRRSAVIAMGIMALLPYQVFHAQQANLYSYLALLSGFQVLFFWSGIHGRGVPAWVGYAISTVIGLYTHYYAALVVVALHVWLLISGRRYRHQWRNLALADLVTFLAFVPLLKFFLDKLGEVSDGFWLSRPDLLTPLSTLHLFTVSYSLPEAMVPVGFLATAMLLALALVELWHSTKRDPGGREATLLVVIVTFLPILLLLIVAQFFPAYLERTLIVTTPAYAVLLGRVAAISRRKSPTPYLMALAVIVVSVSLYGYYSDPAFAKPGYHAAASYLAENVRTGDLVLHSGNGSYIPFLLYLSPENHLLLDGDPQPHHPPRLHELAGGRAVSEAVVQDYSRVWLVVALEHSIEYQKEVVRSFDQKYDLILDTTVGDVIIRLYDVGGT